MRKATKDILFVAWLEVVKNVTFDDYKITDERKKLGVFFYNIDSDSWNKCKSEFFKSETTKTRYTVQRLKDLLN
jgi:hypothetical protein